MVNSIKELDIRAINYCLMLRSRGIRKGNEKARHRTHDCIAWRNEKGQLVGMLHITFPCDQYPEGLVVRNLYSRKAA